MVPGITPTRRPHLGLVARSRLSPRKAGAREGRTRAGGGVSAKERLQRLEPARYADHALSPRTRQQDIHSLHGASAAIVPGRVYAVDRIRIHRVLFRRIGGWARTVRHRCRYPAGFREEPPMRRCGRKSLGLPPLTTIFITHSHWDHVGGHSYFRGLNPRPRFYARSNYQEEIARDVSDAPEVFDKYFFGERFQPRGCA